MNYISKATVAPVVEQGAQYDWEYAGVSEEEEAMEAVPLPEELMRDEAHARADRPRLHGWSKVADMNLGHASRRLKQPSMREERKPGTMWRGKVQDSKLFVKDENQMWHLSPCLRCLSQRRWKDIWQLTCHQPHGANSV